MSNGWVRAQVAVLLLLCFPGFTQETDPAQARGTPAPEPVRAAALLVPRPVGGEEDAPLAKVLAAALSIELARAGLEARVAEEARQSVLANAPLPSLLEEAADADFLVLEGYTREGTVIHLEVEVLRAQGGQQIASASSSRKIDLRLDEIVAPVVQQLLPPMQPYLAEATRRRQEAALAAQAMARAAEAAETGPAAARPGPLPAEPPPPMSPAERTPNRRLELGVGGGVFFPMAELDPLFRLGYQAELYLEHRARWTAAALAFGLYAGYAGLLPSEQGTGSYFGSLVPVGLSLRLGTAERSRLGVHGRLQAGAALNVSPQDKVEQRLTRVLPQFKAGAGLSLALSPRMGLSLDFLYELLLYMYTQDGALAVEPVMGFSVPALFFYTRW